MLKAASTAILALLSFSSQAATEVYNIDSTHTYPSFESEHLWGLSIWRGKFNKTRGKVTLDRTGRSGEVEITVDMTSVDFGWDELNEHAKEPTLSTSLNIRLPLTAANSQNSTTICPPKCKAS